MAEEFRVLRPYEFHCQLMAKGRRADGRTLEDIREIKLDTDAIKTANSSSLVKLGNTSLVCGCTARLLNRRERNDDNNEEIKITVEMPPVCSSPTGYRTQQTAQLLTKTLKNLLDDTDCLNRENLHVNEMDSYWCVDVEVICLNYDGSLLDAALIAVLTALKTLKLTPTDKNVPDRLFQLNSIPVCTSFGIIGDHIVCDPNLEEETVAQSIFSITIDSSSKRNCHINKVGGKSITTKQLLKCIDLAKKRACHIQDQLKQQISSQTSHDENAMDST